MSRLERFYTNSILYEKVSKKEIDDALNNSNIIVGAEFEFIMMRDGKPLSLKDESIFQEWLEAHEEWKEICDLIEQYQDELESYYKETKNLRKKYDKIGTEIDKLNNEWQKAEAKKDTKTMNMLKAAIKIKQGDYSDLEEEIAYRDMEGIKEIDKPPTHGSDTEFYVYYIEEYMGLNGNNELKGSLEGIFPTEPVDMSESTEPTFDPKEINRIFNKFKDAPFKKFKVGQYNTVKQDVGSDVWAVEPDGSLGTAGIEIKSPPMPLPEFMKILPKMFTWMNKYGETTNACGFHVHMSLAGVNNLMGVLDPIKIILFTDEGYVFNLFKERVNNQYTKSMKDKLKTGSIPKKELEKGFNLKQAIMMVSSFEHEDAINLQHIQKGHMEFRYMGGTNYSGKLKEVSSTIGHFAHILAIATDENYKKKEYSLKLSRIFNKIDLIYSKAVLGVINKMKESKIPEVQRELKTSPQVAKIEKEHKDTVKSLERIFKLDTTTLKQIQRNKPYIDSVEKDIQELLKKYVPTFYEWRPGIHQAFK